MKNFFIYIILILCTASCQKEYSNPNAATEESVLNNVDGLLGLCIGIKRQYATQPTGVLYNAITVSGLATKELYVINTGNGELAALESGGSTVGASNTFLTNLWVSCNLVKSNAQLLITNSNNVSDPITSANIKTYGLLFKAIAIGSMCQFWNNVSIETISPDDLRNGKTSVFVSRADGLKESLNLLNEASILIAANPVSKYFISKVGSDLDIKNTINAMIARYSIMAGNYTQALEAANKVDISIKSVFNFDATNQNPVFRQSLVNNNTYNGVPNFGLSNTLKPDSLDSRIGFYLGNNVIPIKINGFFKSDLDPIPVYLPGEITLIKAEAHVRANNLNSAIAEINNLRTKKSDVFLLQSGLSEYTGGISQIDILTEIYKQRAIELYMTGLRLEDNRRFERPGPGNAGAERNRNFYPFPALERDNNPNTPQDPVN